jgi:hypothetical protein
LTPRVIAGFFGGKAQSLAAKVFLEKKSFLRKTSFPQRQILAHILSAFPTFARRKKISPSFCKHLLLCASTSSCLATIRQRVGRKRWPGDFQISKTQWRIWQMKRG